MTPSPTRAPTPSSLGKATIMVVLGTRAQIIKMAPVLRELERRHAPYRLILTGQHADTVDALLTDFGINTTPTWLTRPLEITSPALVPHWASRVLFRLVRTLRSLGFARARTLVVTHGDTLSTLLALLAARLTGCTVAHVEAGLRSDHLFNPFPEEIIRRICARQARIAFAPGPWASGNLQGSKAVVVDTGHNTIVDSLGYALSRASPTPSTEKPYLVTSIHRFENLYGKRLSRIVDLVCHLAGPYRIRFVLHPATRRRLAVCGLLGRLETQADIILENRMSYLRFVSLLAGAEGVLTDGGSNQEELYYLGKPTVILRKTTERVEGLRSTAMLLDPDEASPESVISALGRMYTNRLHEIATPPSRIIVDTLLTWPRGSFHAREMTRGVLPSGT